MLLPSIHHLHEKLFSAISWQLAKLVLCKKLLVDFPTDSPRLSLIPEQGPFHITLNAHETAAELHRLFLHKHLFNSAMPERPKPDLVAVPFLGWLMLRSIVLNLFELCKDLEYVSLPFSVLEQVIRECI